MAIVVDRVRGSEHTTQAFSIIPIMRTMCSVSPTFMIRSTNKELTIGLHTSAYINTK